MRDAEPLADRFRRPKDTRSPRRTRVDPVLLFLDRVLGLDHLHYGLFAGDPLDRAGLVAAQERYLDRLLEMLPPGVEQVLDVGAGTGSLSRRLAGLGLSVEGLSPDPHQAERYRERVGAPFHLGRFQEFLPPHRYDLLVFCESAQYVWIEELFAAIRRAAGGGHALISDYFVVDESSYGSTSGHLLGDFRRRAAAEGLELEAELDVTEQAATTLDLAAHWLQRYVDPSVDILVTHFGSRHPLLFRLARRLARQPLGRIAGARRRADAATFRRLKRYLFLRYRVPAA